MTYLIKKIYSAMTALSIATASFAYGTISANSECDDFCSTPCSQECACWGRGFVSADLLYWTAHQGGLSCECVSNDVVNMISDSGNVISKFKGYSKDHHFDWNAGFRIGAGYEFANRSWDIAAYWTHFHSKINNGNQSNHYHWKLDYEVIDVLLARKFCLDSFTIRPFIGIRGAQIEQKMKLESLGRFNSFVSSTSSSYCSSHHYDQISNYSTSDFIQSHQRNKETFKGIGPLIGIEADWYMGCGFSLYGAVSVSSLYGHFDVQFKGCNSFLNGANICDERTHLYSCQFATDAILGVRWQQCFCNDYQIIFQLALEQHRFFNHNHLGGYGDLCLDGLSFSAGFVF